MDTLELHAATSDPRKTKLPHRLFGIHTHRNFLSKSHLVRRAPPNLSLLLIFWSPLSVAPVVNSLKYQKKYNDSVQMLVSLYELGKLVASSPNLLDNSEDYWTPEKRCRIFMGINKDNSRLKPSRIMAFGRKHEAVRLFEVRPEYPYPLDYHDPCDITTSVRDWYLLALVPLYVIVEGSFDIGFPSNWTRGYFLNSKSPLVLRSRTNKSSSKVFFPLLFCNTSSLSPFVLQMRGQILKRRRSILREAHHIFFA